MGIEFSHFQRAAGKKSLSRVGSSLNPLVFESEGEIMDNFLKTFWSNEEGQDVAEYAVMLAVVLVIVVGTVRLIGTNAGNVFSQVGSSIH